MLRSPSTQTHLPTPLLIKYFPDRRDLFSCKKIVRVAVYFRHEFELGENINNDRRTTYNHSPPLGTAGLWRELGARRSRGSTGVALVVSDKVYTSTTERALRFLIGLHVNHTTIIIVPAPGRDGSASAARQGAHGISSPRRNGGIRLRRFDQDARQDRDVA